MTAVHTGTQDYCVLLQPFLPRSVLGPSQAGTSSGAHSLPRFPPVQSGHAATGGPRTAAPCTPEQSSRGRSSPLVAASASALQPRLAESELALTAPVACPTAYDGQGQEEQQFTNTFLVDVLFLVIMQWRRLPNQALFMV